MDTGDDLRILAKESDDNKEVLSDQPHSCSLRGAITRMSFSNKINGILEE